MATQEVGELMRGGPGHAMNGSGSTGIMAPNNGFAKHDSRVGTTRQRASAICTLSSRPAGDAPWMLHPRACQGLLHAIAL